MWQVKREAKVKEVNQGQGEALCFTIPLGFIQLVCIVHIPVDDEDTSLVYVKCVNPRENDD